LPHAIRNDHLIAYFQPIVDAQHGRMVGIEALARWNHPEQGFISPAKFIPIAEEGPLILELGEKILFQACHIGHQLNQNRQAAGLSPLLIHVNLSARHFASHTLLPTLEETLRITQMPPEQLAIEITETMLLESPRESIRRMQRIKQLGIHLALDDFGTGYSALNTLCQYPIDVVKLDRSFVLRLMEGKQGELLVRAIINMARDLGLDVIAEGVETQAQQQRLCALGIREIQGFYYYRPMSAGDLMALQQS
jgi:EAL domain-containing protein (putative c-di-GMP-specific phosphodiesterase class I)